MEAPKINFMVCESEAPNTVGPLGLEVGQTWRMYSGDLVTITRYSKSEDRFYLGFAETVGVPFRASVDPSGRTKLQSCRDYDLKERVQRIYIAGPMTGHADLNFPAFHAAAAAYRKKGAFVINPAEINSAEVQTAMSAKLTPEQYHAHWVRCTKKDINALMTCDGIVMLPGWQKSRGAKLEHHIARNLGLTITYREV